MFEALVFFSSKTSLLPSSYLIKMISDIATTNKGPSIWSNFLNFISSVPTSIIFA
jgi:hypothetical protein